ncbi:Galactose oxidase/kelch repeat superfamily protein [Striga hermonthica]|uniref:Galactose oxidase/kelch repeat superfamily protein n=1 Tax=Striga hermonthica TaxID=68872 RepID=A0A9N7NIX6_STRHE|nr:Galactose oxidase/kelch repeat superfamily protein [Striga hermonthica]
MAVDERRVYIFGGCGDSGRLNDLWAFDVVDKEWVEFSLLGESVKPRGGPRLASVLEKIWVMYGFTGMEVDDVHYFDLKEGKWVQVEMNGEKPSPRSVFSPLVIGKYIFVYGGETDPSDLGHMGQGNVMGFLNFNFN